MSNIVYMKPPILVPPAPPGRVDDLDLPCLILEWKIWPSVCELWHWPLWPWPHFLKVGWKFKFLYLYLCDLWPMTLTLFSMNGCPMSSLLFFRFAITSAWNKLLRSIIKYKLMTVVMCVTRVSHLVPAWVCRLDPGSNLFRAWQINDIKLPHWVEVQGFRMEQAYPL